jgi:acetylornithine/succinyldiaminopimelate/putrescine aminotransferase
MKTIYNRYSTEDGSLHIGTSKGYSCFPNTSGDGEFDIAIAASWDIDTDGYDYLGMVGGEGFNVYGDDHDRVIALLRGRWGVYADIINNGNMMLRPFDHDSTVMIPHQ